MLAREIREASDRNGAPVPGLIVPLRRITPFWIVG